MDDASRTPDRTTAPELRGILEELAELEPVFHHPELGTTREDFDRLTAEDFWETGASGRRYSREHVWSVLEQRYASYPSAEFDDDWHTSDFQLREIATSTYLLTYTLVADSRTTHRVSVWQRRADEWVILYHQGTPAADHSR